MKLLNENDPFLKIPVDELDISNLPNDFSDTVSEMCHTMMENAAIGLAANQVGIPWRVFVIQTISGIEVCINPKIIESSNVLPNAEGCLSFPGLKLIVHRPNIIKVEYFDSDLNRVTNMLYGIDAVCFCHELDHLNGITFDQRVSKFQFKNALKKRKSKTVID